MSISRLIHGADVELDFTLDPPVQRWELTSERDDGSRVEYQGDGYVLMLDESAQDDRTVVTFSLTRTAGDAFSLRNYTLQMESSGVELHRVWMPWVIDNHTEHIGLDRHQPEDFQSAADRRMPVLFGLDRAGICKLMVGLLEQRVETDIRYTVRTILPDGLSDRGIMRLRFQRPLDGYSLDSLTDYHDGFFVSSGASWFDTMQAYRAEWQEWSGVQVRSQPGRGLGPGDGPLDRDARQVATDATRGHGSGRDVGGRAGRQDAGHHRRRQLGKLASGFPGELRTARCGDRAEPDRR